MTKNKNLKKKARQKSLDLSVELCGVTLENPTVLFSGILVTPQELINASQNGAGAVTSKSVSIEPRVGHPVPTIVRFDQGFLNSVGLKNPGLEKAKEEIVEILKKSKSPLIVSIFANKISEFKTLAKEIAQLKPHFLELNLSCPNVDEEFGRPFATDAKISAQVVETVKKVSGKVPIIPKLSPNVFDIGLIAKACEEAGADAICAINTIGPGMVIDIRQKKPKLGNKKGGVSGPAIKPVAIRCVWDIFEAVKIPIIGGGGITTGEDAVEMMMVGATAVGVGSAVYLRGKDVFDKICQEMKEFMEKEGYQSVQEMRGLAH